MKPVLQVFGINHRTAHIEVRERCALTHGEIQKELERITSLSAIEGCVILCTCNRTEYYVTCSEQSGQFSPEMLFPAGHMFHLESKQSIYTRENEEAIQHLFRVAAGLDSQVLGENEVLFQVKEAYRLSQQMGCLGKKLNSIFERSFRVGRKVRRETGISRGNVSVASLAIKLLKRECGLQGRQVMLIGVNKITSQIAHYLLDHAIRTAFVGNRTYEKAVALAQTLGGEAFPLSSLEQLIRTVDIVITATSAPHFIIKKEKVWSTLEQRDRPLVIVDLAVPRDVDPALRDNPGVILYNLEDISPMVERTVVNKQAEAQKAEQIICREIVRFRFASALYV